MANPRTPTARAKTTGRTENNPGRFNSRKEPSSVPLGKPSRGLNETQRECWESFKREMPWLMESDRGLVETASVLRARLWNNHDLGVQALAQLRMCLSAMGGTPADRSRVSAPEDESDDPAAEFVN